MKEYENIKTLLKNEGYEMVTPTYMNFINEWKEWYSGYNQKFHKYKMYNGFKFIDKQLYSLNLGKRVSEEWSSLLFNDKVCITVGQQDEEGNGGIDQEITDAVLIDNKFGSRFTDLLEKTFALGTGALVVYKDAKDKVKIDYIIAPMIYPISQENGEITECAFCSIKNDTYYIQIHVKENDWYVIKNRMYKLMDNKYIRIENEDILDEVYTPVKQFFIIKPNNSNNIDLFTPYGLSCFANAIDEIKAVDIAFDSLKNEFKLGKKRLFVGTDTLTYKTIVTGNGGTAQVPIFDENQTEFYALPTDEGQAPITEVNSSLRIGEHIDGLQTLLNLFSDNCGLGPDRFVFKDGKVYTNSSQIVSTESKLYKNILKHEKVLREELTAMIRSILYLANGTFFEDDITIDFDDGIVQDKEQIRNQAILELSNGLIDDVQYYVDVYGMTEKQAIEFRDIIKNRAVQEEVEEEPPIEEGE